MTIVPVAAVETATIVACKQRAARSGGLVGEGQGCGGGWARGESTYVDRRRET